jgi:hypothetical protein
MMTQGSQTIAVSSVTMNVLEVPLPQQPAPSAGHRRGLTPGKKNTRVARASGGRRDRSSTRASARSRTGARFGEESIMSK